MYVFLNVRPFWQMNIILASKNNLKENQIGIFYVRGKLNAFLLNVKEEIY